MKYVCSDIHGHYNVYLKAVEKLNADDALYILGDVIDRGPDGIKIIKDMMTRENVVFLLGNHEDMMLKSMLMGERFLANWTSPNNGGTATYQAFCKLPSVEQEEILDWMESRPIYLKVSCAGETYHLVHASWGRELVDVSEYHQKCTRDYPDRLWDSEFRGDLVANALDGTTIVGHVPVIRFGKEVAPFHLENTINIDGGLAYGGGLILYCLDTKEYEVLKKKS